MFKFYTYIKISDSLTHHPSVEIFGPRNINAYRCSVYDVDKGKGFFFYFLGIIRYISCNNILVRCVGR